MNILAFTSLVAVGSFAAGFLGALTGLGGGVVIVPLLVLFGIDLHYAIGALLVSVIATSCGAAASYVRSGYSNIRIAMLLEIATTVGGLTGATLVAMAVIPKHALAVVFGLVLLLSAWLSSRFQLEAPDTGPPDRLANQLHLDSVLPSADGPIPYHVRRVPLGFVLMYLAGVLSGLLGIGSGALKVLAMDQAMRIPFKVSTTTSNFMIGVTAAASAGVYLSRGYIDPGLALPVVLGVLAGSVLGAPTLLFINTPILRRVFSIVILGLAVQMIYQGLFGGSCDMGHPPWNDERIMICIGNLLRIGVVASAIVISIGGVVHLYHHGREKKVDRSQFKAMPAEFSQPGAIVRAALLGRGSSESAVSVGSGQGRGRALIQLGLLLLVATPVLRVAYSIFAFARKRDLVYVVLPTVVLGVLLYSLFSKQIH